MKAAAILVGVLVSLSAASEESTDRPQEPSVEILGFKIVRGMPESEVRASLPNVYCAEKAPDVDPGFDYCSVSDGAPRKRMEKLLLRTALCSAPLVTGSFPRAPNR